MNRTMKRNEFLIFKLFNCCIVAAMLLTACSNDDYLGGHATTDGAGTLMTVTAQISAPSNSTLAWTSGDVIGIAAGYGLYDATARNREYVCQADGATFLQSANLPMYVKGATNIVAYYPYSGSDGAEPTLALNTKDQTNVTDYLFAKATGITPQNGSHVNLVFNYALSELKMNFNIPAGESISTCRLEGFSQQAAVDPYTLDLTMEAPETLVVNGTNPQTVTLKLIPQTIAADAAVPARLVLIGNIRSYTIDMSQVQLTGGNVTLASINLTDGIGSVDFVPGGSAWEDSGVGGSVTAE